MSGKAYPRPTYLPPLSIFNPIFFPQVFPTTSSGGGGGGQTNDFPSGILTGNTITCYSTTGTDRNIYGISLLEFSDSTTNDYTDITTTMELTGSTLTIENTNPSSTINFVADAVQVNGVAIGVGTGNVSNDINNTFQSPATTQTFDTQSVVMDNSALSFPNNGRILWGNGTSILDFPSILPTSGNGSSGLALAWNQTTGGGQGETDFLSYGQGGGGGFSFYSMNSTTTPNLIANMYPSGIDFKKNIISNNTFTGTNTFTSTFSVDNTQSNIGQFLNNNTAIGEQSLLSLTSGSDNTALGYFSLSDVVDGQNNTAVGYTALTNITSGESNTGLGYASLSSCLTDINNTAVGYWSGLNLNGGDNNVFIGYEAGVNQTTGDNNVALGYQVGVDSTTPTLSNTIAIGNGVTSKVSGDMILGFGDYLGSGADYYAKITPNTTDQGVQIQGTYNTSSNFTIDSLGQSVYLKGTNIGLNASNTVSISNILQSPNDPTVDTNTLASGRGTFYVSSQLPYFAYNNAGTITSQQLATASSNVITLQWTAQLSGVNTQWTGYIPYSVNANIVSFQFYTNQPPNDINIALGETVVPSNTQVSGYGIGYKQPYYAGGGTYSYGYVFSILSFNGLSIASPNLLLKSVAIFPQTTYPCLGYLTGANDGGYIYNTPNNGLTLIITQ